MCWVQLPKLLSRKTVVVYLWSARKGYFIRNSGAAFNKLSSLPG